MICNVSYTFPHRIVNILPVAVIHQRICVIRCIFIRTVHFIFIHFVYFLQSFIVVFVIISNKVVVYLLLPLILSGECILNLSLCVVRHICIFLFLCSIWYRFAVLFYLFVWFNFLFLVLFQKC